MRILLVGSKGQLAHDVLIRLGARHDVRGVDLPEFDITDRESVFRGVTGWRPEAVVNCAAYTRVDACETEREAAQAVNAGGPGLLAEAAFQVGAFLVHLSTDYVFDGRRPVPQPYVEDDVPQPINWYGSTKWDGERRVMAAGGDWAILRTAWLYGARGSNFPKNILKRVLAEPDREWKVVADQWGSPTGSRRLAEQIEAVLERRATGLFHATSEGYTDWCAFARFFLENLGVPCRLRPCASAEYPTPARRPVNSILENRRLKEQGLNRFVDWREDVRDFVERHRTALIEEARA